MEIDWTALSNAHPVLATCPASLRKDAQIQSFARGELLYSLGQRPKAMLFVLSGEVRLVRRSAQGSEIILQRARPGFVAEASMDAEHYHCDIVTAAAGALLRFPVAQFRAALAADGAFHSAWSAQLAREVRKLRAQCERLSLKGAAERVLHCIESEGMDGVLALTQTRKAWAAELGLSHEALYRTLRDLSYKGVLSVDGNRIVLVRTDERLP